MEALRERFGKYHVLEKIAQGGMAEVYKVKTVGIAGFEKVQALKRILPSSAREGRFIRSFIDEARIAVELTHRNIVQVFDFGKADGELFLAMELIEGRDLRTAAAQASQYALPCPIPVAAYIAAEVAAGLDYAHRKTDLYGTELNIVHCDVSPSNVMLSLDGYVKILDFGIARATFASALERRRLRGKPRYMAPEQTYGEPPTAAADVFALGIIAWELFTGLALYRGADLKAVLDAVRTTVPARIDRINRDVPAEIVDAVERALQREPGMRGTAADLLAACTRTAMRGGAHALAEWLTAIGRVAPQHAATATATSAQRAPAPPSTPPPIAGMPMAPLPMAGPPVRPSQTMSLHQVPVPPSAGEVGHGTPGFAQLDPEVQRAAAGFEHDRTTTAQAVRKPTTAPTAPAYQRFGDRDPTATAPASAFPNLWSHEATSAGVGRLADAIVASEARLGTIDASEARLGTIDASEARLGTIDASDALPPREATQSIALPLDEVAPIAPAAIAPAAPRPSYASLGAAPAATRWDDNEATQHTMHAFGGGADFGPAAITTVAPAFDATSFDDLEVEPEPPPEQVAAEPPPGDAAIDDDLGALASFSAVERRRSVVVAGVLDGAAPDALRPIARALAELAYQRGGVALALEADALVVAFGLEVAGEDDVAIAMGWAFDAAALTRERGTNAGAGSAGRLRIGAHTGVIATSTADGGARVPPDAIARARSLAREAAPERPLFVGAAGRVTSDLFALREVSTVAHGRALEVVGPRGFEERDRTRLERRGAFVGRARQLAELDAWFERAIAENRRLSGLVTGAAGTGKSRLVAEWIERRHQPSAPRPRVITIAANPASRHSPFALVIELYQAALGLPPARGRAARAALAQRLFHLLKDAGVTDAVARAVATDVDRAMELQGGVGTGAPEVADLRPRVSAGLATFRQAIRTRERPMLTVIEDIHLADGASIEVLRHTLAVTAEGRELLLLTSRPDGPAPPAVDGELVVEELEGAELHALIADRLGPAATPANIAAVIARGGGNPLFVEELAQATREAGEGVPASARDVVAARIDRLSPRARAAVRFAAAMGGAVRARLLEELVGDDDHTASGQRFAAVIDEVVSAGVMRRAAAGDEGELELSRGLVREVVYDALAPRARADAHARIGRLLAARFFAGREEPPAMIAAHLERGGELAAAAAFWLRAGRLAMAASDAASAVAHFSRVLELEGELGPEPVSPASRTRRREALGGRELANRLLGDLTSHPDDIEQLEALCDGDPERLADVAIRRAHRLLRTGDFAGALIATVAAENLAGGAGRLAGEALRVRAELLERRGRFDEALDVVERSREQFEAAGAVVEAMQATVGRGRIFLMRADYDAARSVYRPILARLEQSPDPWLERVVQNHVAIVEMCLGNYAVAMQSAQRSLELCRRYGDRAREGDAQSVAGIVLLEVGLYGQAAATFDDALALLARSGTRWSRADCLIYAGVCAARRDRVADGLAMLDEALAEAQAIGARYLEANALVSRAGVHLARGALPMALADAAAGAAVARGATLIGYELQGLARHAAALVRSPGDHRRDARAAIDRALELFDVQRNIEGSEEDVYVHAIDVLRATGDSARAAQVAQRGRDEVLRKLGAITDPAWRAAYSARAECRRLLG